MATDGGNRSPLLPVVLVLVAAAVILFVVLFLLGDREESAPAGSASDLVATPGLPSREAPAPPPPHSADVAETQMPPPRFEPAEVDNALSTEIPPERQAEIRSQPEMPEDFRYALEHANEIPPERQAEIDNPPTVSDAELEALRRMATEHDIPPDVLEEFEEAARRFNEGQP